MLHVALFPILVKHLVIPSLVIHTFYRFVLANVAAMKQFTVILSDNFTC